MTAHPAVEALALGAPAPAFELPATDGKTYSSETFKDDRVLVVIFSSTHCPYVAAWQDRMSSIGKQYAGRAGFVAINASDAGKPPQQALQEMRQQGEEADFPFPYLYDQDQSVARRYGATRTPEVLVFDQGRRLRYHGAIDSDWEESSHLQNYLREALDRLLTGQSIYLPETPLVGCPITYQ